MNALLWGLALLIVAASFFGNYYFSDKSTLLRVITMIVMFGVAAFSAASTTHGKKFIKFVQESKLEARKVVWPKRQETMQMTGIVLLMVTVVGLFLWGIDGILIRLIGWFTGLGA